MLQIVTQNNPLLRFVKKDLLLFLTLPVSMLWLLTHSRATLCEFLPSSNLAQGKQEPTGPRSKWTRDRNKATTTSLSF